MSGSSIIQSLAKGMDVLALLAEAEGGLRVKDVAELAGLKPPVAHNVLRTLKSRGFVCRDASAPVYRLGARLEELVARRNRHALYRRVEVAMRSLADNFPDATLTFSQPINGDVVVRRRLSADGYGVIQQPSGFSLALYSSASGLASLAFCSEEDCLALQQRHPLLEEGARLWSPPETLDAYLEQVRRQGCSLHPYADARRLAVACPVRDAEGAVSGVLGLARTAPAGATLGETARAAAVEQLKKSTAVPQ